MGPELAVGGHAATISIDHPCLLPWVCAKAVARSPQPSRAPDPTIRMVPLKRVSPRPNLRINQIWPCLGIGAYGVDTRHGNNRVVTHRVGDRRDLLRHRRAPAAFCPAARGARDSVHEGWLWLQPRRADLTQPDFTRGRGSGCAAAALGRLNAKYHIVGGLQKPLHG